MPVYEICHPLAKHKIGLMRETHSVKKFRELSTELSSLLAYEASKDLPLENHCVEGWHGCVEVQRLKGKKLTLVPILRAGLGMLEGILDLLPNARISLIGLARNENTLQAEAYFAQFVGQLSERMAWIIDPMLATGGSVLTAITMLKRAGCPNIRVLTLVCAPEGIQAVHHAYPEMAIYTVAIDTHLNAQGYIVPGLGDAGDKLFGSHA